MNYEILNLETKNNIAIITINRPDALNALNSKFFIEMNDMLKQISSMEHLKCLIIIGKGKAFVAGADISEMVTMNNEQAIEFSQNGQNTFNRIEQLPIPVIAAVNGFALGGGCELAMACDIRIASTKAKFGQPEVNLGLIPGYAGTCRLPKHVGLGNALYLLTTADIISAEEAMRMGLIQKVVEDEKLLDETIAIATKIASKGPLAVKKVKMVTRKVYGLNQQKAEETEAHEFGALFGKNTESYEGMTAFLEKRQPNWNK